MQKEWFTVVTKAKRQHRARMTCAVGNARPLWNGHTINSKKHNGACLIHDTREDVGRMNEEIGLLAIVTQAFKTLHFMECAGTVMQQVLIQTRSFKVEFGFDNLRIILI
uniref:Uncharacterized protein n=1 Tax=Glossina pallidipes TaxID=7398 RepID=A0A1B0A929_GLOPL